MVGLGGKAKVAELGEVLGTAENAMQHKRAAIIRLAHFAQLAV